MKMSLYNIQFIDSGNTVGGLAHEISNRCCLCASKCKAFEEICWLCDIMTCLSLPWALVKWNIDRMETEEGTFHCNLMPCCYPKLPLRLCSLYPVLCHLLRYLCLCSLLTCAQSLQRNTGPGVPKLIP